MNDRVDASVTAIQGMEIAVGRLAGAVSERLPIVEGELRRVSESLEERHAELKTEVSSLRDQISSAAEDEDAGWMQRRLEEAEEELGTVRRQIARLSETAAAYRAQARAVEGLANEQSMHTREYLREAADDLKRYIAFDLDDATSCPRERAVRSPSAGSRSGSPGGACAADRFDPTGVPLPVGFVWIPIDAIDRSAESGGFANADQFKKVTREEFIRGYEALRNEILPAVARLGATADSSFFARLDQEHGRPHEFGIQRPFDAFFGSDHIRLSRGSEAELFNVTNGRHRIVVAVKLGWKAVPAVIRQPETL